MLAIYISHEDFLKKLNTPLVILSNKAVLVYLQRDYLYILMI